MPDQSPTQQYDRHIDTIVADIREAAWNALFYRSDLGPTNAKRISRMVAELVRKEMEAAR